MKDDATCKGSVMLGTACGKCKKCYKEIANIKSKLNKVEPPQVESMGDSPILDTMWQRCLMKMYVKAKDEGKETIEIVDVDDYVVRVAKMPFTDMMKELGT